MRLIKPLSVVAFLFIFSSSFGQNDFKDGFIIKPGQNYVYGSVSIPDSPEKYAVVFFKETPNGKVVQYTPTSIEGYGLINQNHYRTREIEVNGPPQKMFLESVADGKITLYSFNNRFFIERGNSFYELKSDATKRSAFQSIITSLMEDCPGAVKKVKSTPIELNKLIPIVNAYNSCSDDNPVTRDNEFSIRPELFVGVDRTSFFISGVSEDFLEKKFVDRTLLHAGANLIISFSKNLSFQTGLWFNDQRFSLVLQETSSAESGVYIARVNHRVFKIPFLLRLDNLTNGKAKMYLKAGALFSITKNGEAYWSQEISENNTIVIDQYPISKTLKEPMQIHLAAGAIYPLSNRVSVFSELWFSTGTKSIQVENPLEGKSKVHFTGLGANFGVRLNYDK